MNENGLFKKITKIKMFPYIILAIVAGIILIIFPAENDTDESTLEQKSVFEYTAKLEAQIEELLEDIDGIKGSRVMVFADTSYSYLYASDQDVESDDTRRKVSKHIVLTTVDGKESPIVIEEYLPSLSGIAVVVDCNDPQTISLIKNLLCSLFELDESRIFITS